jgi:hypothetical protein
VDEEDFPSPFLQDFADLSCEGFESWILDLIATRELLDEELTIRSQLDLACSELYSTTDSEECGSVFGDIISRMSDILVSPLEGMSCIICDEYSTSCNSRISPCTAICVDYEFHGRCLYELLEPEELRSQIIYKREVPLLHFFIDGTSSPVIYRAKSVRSLLCQTIMRMVASFFVFCTISR